MMVYILVEEGFYEGSTIYGAFTSESIAREVAESGKETRDGMRVSRAAHIEEWDDDKQTAKIEREWKSPLNWVRTDYP